MDTLKLEANEVFETRTCAQEGGSEIEQPEKNTDTINESNMDIKNETPLNNIVNNENDLRIEKNGTENPNIIEPVVAIENEPIEEINKASKKVSIPSNKRKSDNQTDSNIEEKKNYIMRKNLRGVINENNFDTITIAAQREESERLARVQMLKKSVKQKYNHSALGLTIEGLPFDSEINDQVFSISETQDSPHQSKISSAFSLKENQTQNSYERKNDKKVWNQWFSSKSETHHSDKKVEVVTIDSSSESDDCIILSDSDDCLDDDPEDDHHNSGLHVRDVLNIPNEEGKVLVNVGHVESEPDIYVAPQIAKIIKPHQIGGVRFLFDNIIESTKRFNNSSGFGCILAHSMGLGKTLQVVTFSDIFLRHTDAKTILCVMPINTIQNWVREFNLWLPEESTNPEEVRPRHFPVFAINDQHKTMSSRSKVILRWASEGGVLLIGYELFRVLGLKIIKKKDAKTGLENAHQKRLIDQMHNALVKPGPDLVICDEGHRIKNAHAGISIALKQIRSRRRIVLTGYPLQNNLLEYWCMVDFVRPNYLGSKTEFCNMFERPIQNGQCIDSTPEDIKLMRYRAHVLHSLLVGFVQRRSDSVLQNSLPQKLEYVILTKMTKFQRKLYNAFMNEVVRKKKVPNPLKAFAVCCKIWNHPDVLYEFLKKRDFDVDLDIDEQETIVKTSPEKPNSNPELKSLLNNNTLNESIYQNSASQQCSLDYSKKNPNTLWQENDSIVDAQQHKLDYIGMLAKPSGTNNTETCSSQIVDLDTKEVQLIKSDLTANLEVKIMPNVKNNLENVKTDVQGHYSSMKIGKSEMKTGNEAISYDWAFNLIKDYEPGVVSNSPKMEIFLYILNESVKIGDRVLVFSQSLLTLNLIELFLQSSKIPDSDNNWKKNVSYFRLDGSTSSCERERLVNEFNSNTDVKLFLISTRAGSLGINLTGANRVIVFDASWNPCHDTQAVHRIYRYGQGKSCFVYRIVMDNCMEKNIYDRQVKKQGMSDRVVDECNPDAHLSIRELTNLCYDAVDDDENIEFKTPIENFSDEVVQKVIINYKNMLSKEPFYHESLLIDRKDKKLSQLEKKLAKRGYEIEKKASSKPQHFIHNVEYKVVQNKEHMLNQVNLQNFRRRPKEPVKNSAIKLTRWIPAEVWQRQGMSSQEMMLPIDVAIPTNSNDTSNIVVKAGEKVMVLNSPKGVYMQLESGKIIAIKTSQGTALERARNQAKKIGYSEVSDKKSLPTIDPTKVLKEVFRRRVQPLNTDTDNDDVIVINDSITDDIKSPAVKMPHTNSKNRSDPKPIIRESLPQRIQTNKPTLIPTDLRKDIKATVPIQNQQKFETKIQPEPLPMPEYVEKRQGYLFNDTANNSNYEVLHQNLPPHPTLPAQNVEMQHYPPMVPHQWDKSPDMYKQSVKISNIPAPYPSTAVCDLSAFDKSEKLHIPTNETGNADQYTSSYPSSCKDAEEAAYNPPLNYSTNYHNNLPHPPPPQPPAPTEDIGTYNPLYYNNKNDNNYNEHMYESSDPSHSNYHQPMSKYSYSGYYQPPYLPNFVNKTYDNNVYPPPSSQYYMRRPSTYSNNSTNGIDVGFNYADPQDWTKKHLPD